MGKGLTSELKRIWQTLQAMTGRRGLASAAPSTALGTGSICSMGAACVYGGGGHILHPKTALRNLLPPPQTTPPTPPKHPTPPLGALGGAGGAVGSTQTVGQAKLWVNAVLWISSSYGSAHAVGQPPPSATPAPFRSSSGISPNPNPRDGTPPVVQPQPGFLCRCFGTKPQKIEVAELTEAVPASVPQPRPAAGQLAGIVARAEAPMGMKARGRRGPAGPEARRRHGSGTGPGQRPSGAAAARRRARSRDSPSPPTTFPRSGSSRNGGCRGGGPAATRCAGPPRPYPHKAERPPLRPHRDPPGPPGPSRPVPVAMATQRGPPRPLPATVAPPIPSSLPPPASPCRLTPGNGGRRRRAAAAASGRRRRPWGGPNGHGARSMARPWGREGSGWAGGRPRLRATSDL